MENYNLGKRGLSSIVATVLILLITVAAFGIVAGFIVPFVRDNLGESTQCFGFDNYYKFEEKIDFRNVEYRYNCKQEDLANNKNLYGFSVKAGNVAEEKLGKLNGFKIVFYDDKKSKAIEITNEESLKIGIIGDGIGIGSPHVLKVPSQGEISTFAYVGTLGERYDKM